ncbi:MAG TPA: hypothetical protein VKJ00_09485 [Thermoanaerobaculia bacterium]|nr:hypothetical protein [Thermoanaerobaculia bacterium]
MPERPSLDIIYAAVLRTRAAQREHAESLDLKAGILLGFVASILAVSLSLRDSPVAELGRLAAATSALLATWSFWPRNFPEVDPGMLRRLYMTSDSGLTTKVLADTELQACLEAMRLIAAKATRLKGATASLALATVLLFLGALIGGK